MFLLKSYHPFTQTVPTFTETITEMGERLRKSDAERMIDEQVELRGSTTLRQGSLKPQEKIMFS